MQYSLSNRLSSNVSGIDPDARLYIAAVETALGTSIATALPSATSNPKRILSDFIKTEKAASRWSLHKRIYLPIYANAAASAVDMVSRTSGEFTLSGVTHAAGYVQGDGTSGFFDVKATPFALGQTTASLALSFISKNAELTQTRAVFSAYQSSIQMADLSSTAIAIQFTPGSTQSNATIAGADQTGVLIASREGGQRRVHRRNSSAFSTLLNTTLADSGIIPTIDYNIMRSRFGGGGFYSGRQLGSFGIHMGLTELQADGFSANLKILWESLTGLTLP
jgi:hypothetical protein